MKARLIFFYCAAVVALVLILAAVPSHATERRDPLIIQDTQQPQGGKTQGTAQSTKKARASHKRHAGANSLSEAKNKSVVKNDSSASGKNADSAQNGSSTAAK